MWPCVWELWLPSLGVFVDLAARCCADVLFESTCSSTRCCCSHEDRQSSRQAEYNAERCRCSPLVNLWRGIGSRHRASAETPLGFGCSPRGWPLMAFFLSFSYFFPHPLSSTATQERQRHIGNQLGLFSWQRTFPHFWLRLLVCSLTGGCGWIQRHYGRYSYKGLLLESSLLST